MGLFHTWLSLPTKGELEERAKYWREKWREADSRRRVVEDELEAIKIPPVGSTDWITVEDAAKAVVFLYDMFSQDGEDIQSWIDELEDECPPLATAVSAIMKAKT